MLFCCCGLATWSSSFQKHRARQLMMLGLKRRRNGNASNDLVIGQGLQKQSFLRPKTTQCWSENAVTVNLHLFTLFRSFWSYLEVFCILAITWGFDIASSFFEMMSSIEALIVINLMQLFSSILIFFIFGRKKLVTQITKHDFVNKAETVWSSEELIHSFPYFAVFLFKQNKKEENKIREIVFFSYVMFKVVRSNIFVW